MSNRPRAGRVQAVRVPADIRLWGADGVKREGRHGAGAILASMSDVELYVARQPIFDVHLHVYAYELLYRSGVGGGFDGADPNLATARVINAAFYSVQGTGMLGGKPAFINFPQRMLEEEDAIVLPPRATVIEVLEDVEATEAVRTACRRLRSQGFRVALDDVADRRRRHPLAAEADIVKVDYRAAGADGVRMIPPLYGPGLTWLAEKVETHDEYREARAAGYTLFQGYFFARPEITAARDIPASKVNYLRILREVQRPDLDLAALTRLIRIEPSLAYKLVRFVNSALFSPASRIESIEQAVTYVGEEKLRRWLAVVALADLNSGKPHELLVNCMVRARFAELLAPAAGLGQDAGDLFLTGMFSRPDAMLGRPLEELLEGLPLAERVRRCLLGEVRERTGHAGVWRLVLEHEKGDWPAVNASAAQLGIEYGIISAAYAAAVEWADAVTQW